MAKVTVHTPPEHHLKVKLAACGAELSLQNYIGLAASYLALHPELTAGFTTWRESHAKDSGKETQGRTTPELPISG